MAAADVQKQKKLGLFSPREDLRGRSSFEEKLAEKVRTARTDEGGA